MEWKCDIARFQETKIDCTSSAIVRSLCGSPFVDRVVLDANHSAGGVLMMWDRRVFEKVDCSVGSSSVSINFKGVVDGSDWFCARVYGPTDDSLRDALWEELDSMKVHWSLAWCLIGDFNVIRYPAERLDCTSFNPATFDFLDFNENNNMVNLLIKKKKKTWLIFHWKGGEYTRFRDSDIPYMFRIDISDPPNCP